MRKGGKVSHLFMLSIKLRNLTISSQEALECLLLFSSGLRSHKSNNAYNVFTLKFVLIVPKISVSNKLRLFMIDIAPMQSS